LVSHWVRYDAEEPFVPNLDKFGFVYLITNTKTTKAYVGCKQYFIGKTKKESKWQTYIGSSKYLKKDIKKIGKEHFTFEVIAEYKNKRSLRYYEMYYQVKWKVLTATIEGSDEQAFYNSYVGGKFFRPVESYTDPDYLKKLSDSHKGQKVSDETRKKLSEKLSGSNNGMFGKKQTDEAKKKIGEFQKKLSRNGRPLEVKEKIRQSLLGHKVSDETRKKLSKAHKGHPISNKTRDILSKKMKLIWKKRKEENNGN
jgi:hypothetical protein